MYVPVPKCMITVKLDAEICSRYFHSSRAPTSIHEPFGLQAAGQRTYVAAICSRHLPYRIIAAELPASRDFYSTLVLSLRLVLIGIAAHSCPETDNRQPSRNPPH